MQKDIVNENKVIANNNMFYLFFKRILDIVISALGIITLSPIFIIVFILIKIEEPKDKVIFSQIRCGINSEPFKMYKFRSMISNAEEMLDELKYENEMDGPVFKIKNDPRITKIGRFIRKTSIDELPQLFNVLKGDMSLVGPRPPLPREVEKYDEFQLQRLIVKPGITCYWQVSGRNNISFENWVLLDHKYIEERSFLLDLKLILKTVFVVLKYRDGI